MNAATNETTLFVFYKSMVAEAAGVTIDALKPFASRIGTAYDMGEPVWMVAEEMKLRCVPKPVEYVPFYQKSLRKMAVRVVKM